MGVGGLWVCVARCWVLRGRLHGALCACLVLLLCVVVWVCVVFENFTVDASIFVDFDKLLSAIGGCLGTKSR